MLKLEHIERMPLQSTVWCSEIGSLTSLDACNSGASSGVREPISLHHAVLDSRKREEKQKENEFRDVSFSVWAFWSMQSSTMILKNWPLSVVVKKSQKNLLSAASFTCHEHVGFSLG